MSLSDVTCNIRRSEAKLTLLSPCFVYVVFTDDHRRYKNVKGISSVLKWWSSFEPKNMAFVLFKNYVLVLGTDNERELTVSGLGMQFPRLPNASRSQYILKLLDLQSVQVSAWYFPSLKINLFSQHKGHHHPRVALLLSSDNMAM